MKKKLLFLIVFGFILSVTLVACGGEDEANDASNEASTTSESESTPQVLNLTEGSQIPTMDSAMATDAVAFQWLNETMEGLYRLNETGDPVPAIASEDPVVSDDQLEWTVQLRDDAVWSNGDPVTAHDFVFAWRRAVDPNTGSEYGPYMLGGVIKNAEAIANSEADVESLGIEALSDYELKITLEKPVPYFHSLLSFGTYLPQNEAYVTEQGDNYALNAENLLYNGPFVLESWDPAGENSNQWKLVKNDQYWDKENVKLSEINVSIVKEVSAGVNLYETGEVDRIFLSSEYVSQYGSHEHFTTQPEPTIFYTKFNQANEYLQNVDVRKAIAMSINKEDFVDVILADGSTALNGAVPAGFTKHPESGEDFRALNGDFLSFDIEKAKEHWQQALDTLGVNELELRLLGSDTDVARQTNDYLKNQLETNLEGLTINVSAVPFEERLARNGRGDYDIQFSGWGPDYLDPNTFLEMWTSTSPYMTDSYENLEYDALINEAKNDLHNDLNKRYENFLEAEKVLMEDAAIAPIYQRSRALLLRPTVQGVIFNQVGADYTYKYAYIE